MSPLHPPHYEPSPRPVAGLSPGESTLDEVPIAVLILVVAMLGAAGTLTQLTLVGDANRESTAAHQAARSMMETLQATPFDEVFASYNADPTDDPDGPGTAPGANFAVPGLSVRQGDADGFAGRVLLPVSTGNTLRETLNDPDFGLPADLNGDGVVDGLDHRDDAVLLPVRVRVQWTGTSGDRTAEFFATLGRRR